MEEWFLDQERLIFIREQRHVIYIVIGMLVRRFLLQEEKDVISNK